MEDLRGDILRHQVTEQPLRRLVEDVVHLSGAELLGFGFDDRFLGNGKTDACGLGRVTGCFLLLLGHLLGDGDLVRAEFADGQKFFDDDAL